MFLRHFYAILDYDIFFLRFDFFCNWKHDQLRFFIFYYV